MKHFSLKIALINKPINIVELLSVSIRLSKIVLFKEAKYLSYDSYDTFVCLKKLVT